MTAQAITVERATLADVTDLADVITKAFVDLVPSEWLHQARAWRLERFPAWFSLDAERAVKHGIAYTVRDPSGDLPVAAALWIPSTAPTLPDYQERLRDVVGDDLFDRFMLFDTKLGQAHPPTEHDTLAIMGVLPEWQNKGIGSAMLETHYAHLDAAGMLACLQAANVEDQKFYRLRGWADFGPTIVLPPDGPVMFPMTRNPVRRDPI